MEKVITDYSHKTIDETNEIWIKVKGPFSPTRTGLVGNTNIVWVVTVGGTTATDCIAAGLAWRNKQDEAVTGSDMIKLAAKTLMGTFHDTLKVVSLEANVGLGGNELGLVSTGLTMAKPGDEVGQMDQAIINSLDRVAGVAGRCKVNIKTSQKFCHGTNYEYRKVGSTDVISGHSNEKHIFFIEPI